MIKKQSKWEVLTPSGWSDFSSIKKIKKENFITLIFNNKNFLSCSSNHRIKIETGKFIYARDIKLGCILYTGEKITKIKKINKSVFLYDLLNVEKNNEYYTNDIVSHNCAFLMYASEMFKSVWPIISTGGDCTILSTPNGEGEFFHDQWVKAVNGLSDFVPTQLPYWLKKEYDAAWVKSQKEILTDREFLQEYCCDFQGSGNTVVNIDAVRKYFSSINHPNIITKNYSGMLHIYEQPIPEQSYIIGSDTTNADGVDFSTFQVLKYPSNEQVAEFYGQVKTNILAAYLAETGNEYNNALLVVENNNTGLAVLMDLVNLEYKNIYYTAKGEEFNVYLNPNNINYIVQQKTIDMQIGFSTTVKTRPIVLNRFGVALDNCKLIFHSERLMNELKTWIYKKGRMDHADGAHDDLIMAYAIANFVSKHLQKIEIEKNEINQIQNTFDEINMNAKKRQVKILANTYYADQNKNNYKRNMIVKVGNEMLDLNNF